jgi:DNA-binding transcriptional LysR family regulator
MLWARRHRWRGIVTMRCRMNWCARRFAVTLPGRSTSSRLQRDSAAVRAGLGWGMFPDSLAEPHLTDGSFVRVSDVHLDVPLFWQCWKLDSPIVGRITDAMWSSAAANLRTGKSLPRRQRLMRESPSPDWSGLLSGGLDGMPAAP